MSARLPVIAGRQAVKVFQESGFEVLAGRGKGSHIVLAKRDWPAILTVPDRKTLKRGLLRALIRQSGMTVEEFVSLL